MIVSLLRGCAEVSRDLINFDTRSHKFKFRYSQKVVRVAESRRILNSLKSVYHTRHTYQYRYECFHVV